jgi:hypothetical protein
MKSMFDDGSFNDTESHLNKTNKTAFGDVLKLQSEAQNSIAGTSQKEEKSVNRSRSKKRLEELKNTYNSSAIIEDLFPVKGTNDF